MRQVSLWAVLLSAAVLVSGCGKKEQEPAFVKKAERTIGAPGVPPEKESGKKEFNVGDAETSIDLNLEIDPESKGPQVVEDNILTAKKTLNQSNVTLKDPNQKNLWVRITVRPSQSFSERAVALRGVLERDGQPIASFQTVLGKYATEKDPGDGSMKPRQFRVDALQGLTTHPESMLLFARTEVLLAPKGTDEKSIDPATLQADPADVSAKMSNPLRVTFPPAGAPPVSFAAPVETAAPAPAPAGAAQ